jgi:hypothetical protein
MLGTGLSVPHKVDFVALARSLDVPLVNWPVWWQNLPVKYWELVADKLSKAGWSLGWVSAVDTEGRTIWFTDDGYSR